MPAKAVFLDRDRTIIEDPGYLTEPEAVRLLPGADLALRSLSQAGFKLVVVTNQSAVARGMLTEEGLQQVHAELRRQLAQRGVHLDGIYYCPYHPEGTVQAYARDSDERKPNPGMLLRAARELDIDLSASWMVGDSPRDVEAGQRAGCRTIRVRVRSEDAAKEGARREGLRLEQRQDEDVQADFSVRNLVDAARLILRESGISAPGAGAGPAPDGAARAAARHAPQDTSPAGKPPEQMDDDEVLREILRLLRQISRQRPEPEFSAWRLLAVVFQVLALFALGLGLIHMPAATSDSAFAAALLGVISAGALQLVALTFFYLSGRH